MTLLTKVRSGDPLRIPAAAYNAFVDAAHVTGRINADVGRPAASQGHESHVLVRNESGEDLPRFGVLGIVGPILEPGDDFKRRTAVVGAAITVGDDYVGRFVVAREPIAPGRIGWAVVLPGLRADVPWRAQYEWMSTCGLDGATVREGRVAEVRLGEHNGFHVINGRIKATFEHPLLVRRGDAWGFCSAALLRVGDHLVTLVGGQLAEERIETLERIDARARTVAIYVPGTNTYVADEAWTHNDVSGSPTISLSGASSGSSSSGSGSSSGSSSGSGSKSSGSSFSRSGILTISTGGSSGMSSSSQSSGSP